MIDVSVVVPARNAEHQLDDCLASICHSGPREVIVVDGMSTDGTLDIARRHGVRLLSDNGRGLPEARMIGARAAASNRVVLIDADVILPPGALAELVEEFESGAYGGLQAGLRSVSGRGYWGRALVQHHRSGRSKDWFGVVATILRRDVLLAHGFDQRFSSGEDIDLRWRLQHAGVKVGVSRRTIVAHRFEDTFDFAKGQWLADGHGLGRMLCAHGARAGALIGLPLAAAIRGIALSLGRLEPQWIPYYLCFALYNYAGVARELRLRRSSSLRAAVGRP